MLNKPEVDMVATYLDSDMDAEAQLPAFVRDYCRCLSDPPRPAVVLQSYLACGGPATIAALRERSLLTGLHGSY